MMFYQILETNEIFITNDEPDMYFLDESASQPTNNIYYNDITNFIDTRGGKCTSKDLCEFKYLGLLSIYDLKW